MKREYIALILISVLSMNANASSVSYPDSINTNASLDLSIAHKINGKTINSNPQTGVSYGPWGSWETTSFMDNCTQWTPDASTVRWGETFIQTTYCSAEETRSREVTYTYQNGFKRTETQYETAKATIDDEQDAIGTKNYIVKESSENTTWADSGALYNCTSWSPSVDTVEQGKTFTQKSSCKQDQVSTKTTYNHWANGTKTVKSKTTENRTLDESRSRTATGTKVMSYWKTVFSGSTYDDLRIDVSDATEIRATVEFDLRGRTVPQTVSLDVPNRLARYFASNNSDSVDTTACGKTTCVASASVHGEVGVYNYNVIFRGGYDEEYLGGAYAKAFVRLVKVEALVSK